MDYLKSSLAAPGVVLIELNRPEKRNALNNATLKNWLIICSSWMQIPV